MQLFQSQYKLNIQKKQSKKFKPDKLFRVTDFDWLWDVFRMSLQGSWKQMVYKKFFSHFLKELNWSLRHAVKPKFKIKCSIKCQVCDHQNSKYSIFWISITLAHTKSNHALNDFQDMPYVNNNLFNYLNENIKLLTNTFFSSFWILIIKANCITKAKS